MREVLAEMMHVWRSRSGGAQLPVNSLPPSLRFMRLASLLLPLAFLCGAVWYDHNRLTTEALADVDRFSAVAKEPALKVVETNSLVLGRMDARIQGLSWDEIEAQGESIQP